MKTVCKLDLCVGCMACINVCPNCAISIKDDIKHYNAIIDEDLCVNCGLCYKSCQVMYPPELSEPLRWYQGWANNDEIRRRGASGGIATSIAQTFIENGGSVVSCIFQNGDFIYTILHSVEELFKISGSKYVKSNPQLIYKSVKKLLLNKHKVLFIGLPCQVGGLKLFLKNVDKSNLYTIDLICHGTPSPKILSIFLEQYGKNVNDIDEIEFRKKNKYRLHINGENLITKSVCDRYTIAFLKGIIHTDNCCKCQYAQINRISDLTLGDSWGTELLEELNRGISLIIANTNQGLNLLSKSNIHLEDVDKGKAIQNNEQLSKPPGSSKQREKFFARLDNSRKFNSLVTRFCPSLSIKSDIKTILIKLKIYKV